MPSEGWRFLPLDILDKQKAEKIAADWASSQMAQVAQSWADMHRKTTDALLTLYGPQAPAEAPQTAPGVGYGGDQGGGFLDTLQNVGGQAVGALGDLAGGALKAATIPAQVGRLGFPEPGVDSGESPGQKLARLAQGSAQEHPDYNVLQNLGTALDRGQAGFDDTLAKGVEIDPSGGFLSGAANKVARIGTDPLTTIGGSTPRTMQAGQVAGGVTGAGLSAATGAGPTETAANIESGVDLGMMGGPAVAGGGRLAARAVASETGQRGLAAVREAGDLATEAGIVPGMSIKPVGQAPALAAATSPPAGPLALSTDPALRKIQEQFEPVKITTSTLPQRLDTMWTSLARQLTDRGVDLSHYQQLAEKTYGRPLTAEEQVRDLSRLNPFMAAKVTVDEGLKPALQAAGDDLYAPVRNYMIARGNVDVAAALERRTTEQVLATPLKPTLAEQAVKTGESRVRMLERFRNQAQAAGDTMKATDYEQRIAEARAAIERADRRSLRQVTAADQARADRAQEMGAAVAANRQFSGGVDAAQSQQALDALERDLGPERFAKVSQLADQVFDFNLGLLQEKLDAGLINQKQFDQWTQEYPSYTPVVITDYLKGQMDGAAGQGTGLGVNSNGIKVLSIEGTEKVREDPWAASVRNAYETEALVKRNSTFNAFAKTIEDNPTLQALFPRVTGDVTTTNQQRLVHGFVDGEKVTYMAQTPEMARVIKQEGITPVAGLAPAMQLYKELITSKNPTFLVGNAAIDAPIAFLRMLSREGGNPLAAPSIVVDLAKGYLDAFKGVLSDEFKGDTARYLKAGGGMGGHFSREVKDVAKQVETLRQPEYLQVNSAEDAKRLIRQLLVPQGRLQTAATAGGAAYGAFSAGEDATSEDRLANAAKGAAMGLGATKAIAATPRLGERIELGPRVAAFRQAERQGLTMPQAVGRGRSVTMDFQDGGALVKQLNQLIPFLNPAVQGMATPYRMYRENPRGATLAGMALVAPTLMAEAWNHADPQRAQDYADVPDYIKDRGLVIMLPGEAPVNERGERQPQHIDVNLREFAPVVQLTREVTNRVTGGQPRTAGALLSGILQQVSPIQSPSQAMFPGASTAVELYTNRDVYRNAPIVTAHADEAASSLSRDVAGGLTAVRRHTPFVGDEGAPAVPPSAVQYATSDVLGTVAQQAHGASDLLAGRTQHSGTPQDIPVAGGFVRRFMRGDTGQNLKDAQEGSHLLNDQTQAILHAGGIDIQATPVKGEIDKARLTRQEQARYQQLVNERVNDAIEMMAERPDWDRADQAGRLALVQKVVATAHQNAASEMRRDIGPQDLKERAARDRERSAVLAR